MHRRHETPKKIPLNLPCTSNHRTSPRKKDQTLNPPLDSVTTIIFFPVCAERLRILRQCNAIQARQFVIIARSKTRPDNILYEKTSASNAPATIPASTISTAPL